MDEANKDDLGQASPARAGSPRPGPQGASGSAGAAGDLAAEALRAVQSAVSSLKQDAQPTPANSGAGHDALAAVRAAIEQAKGNNQAISTGPVGGTSQGSFAGATSGSDRAPEPVAPTPQRMPLPSFGAEPMQRKPEGIDLLADVNLNVKIELGRTRMLVEDVLRLGQGSVVELDKLAGDPVDIYVNDRHVARGEVLVLNDSFCVRVNEIVAAVGVPAVAR